MTHSEKKLVTIREVGDINTRLDSSYVKRRELSKKMKTL